MIDAGDNPVQEQLQGSVLEWDIEEQSSHTARGTFHHEGSQLTEDIKTMGASSPTGRPCKSAGVIITTQTR